MIISTNNKYDKNSNSSSSDNSPGQRPIGVLDLLQGCVCFVPRPRKVGAPGSPAAEVGPERSRQPRVNLRQGHGALVFAMDPVDAFTMLPKNEGI